jgi:RNA polymerase sigma-70 factor (ECF subfamily)
VIASRILGSPAEADDAVQEAWLRLSRLVPSEIGNLGGWLTTVVARVCLSMLRSRNYLHEEPLEAQLSSGEELDPEDEAVLADSVGLALRVVLDLLTPLERLAFVLHDIFGLPFEEIAVMADRTPEATRQLASRARRRVKGAEVPTGPAVARQREVVDAFFAASRGGDFEALVAVLDPGVMLRIDAELPASVAFTDIRGAEAVAGQALNGLAPALRSVELRPVFVRGAVGMIVSRRGRPITVMSFILAHGKIAEIDAITDRESVEAITAVLSGT